MCFYGFSKHSGTFQKVEWIGCVLVGFSVQLLLWENVIRSVRGASSVPGAGVWVSVNSRHWPVLVHLSACLGFPCMNSHQLVEKSSEHGNSKQNESKAKGRRNELCIFTIRDMTLFRSLGSI